MQGIPVCEGRCYDPKLRRGYSLLMLLRSLTLIFMFSASCTLSLQSHSAATQRSEYATHWENLLISEYEHASSELREKRKSLSRRRLEESGISFFGAMAEPDTELFGEKIVRVVKPGESRFRDRFTRGDVLLFTPTSRGADPVPRECLVVDIGRDWMTVGVGHTWPPGLWESRKVVGFYEVRLDRAAPRAPLRAQRSALDSLRQGRAGRAANIMARLFTDDFADADKLASRPPSRIESFAGHDIRIQDALNEAQSLTTFEPNQSQQDAIRWALQRSISLIRGPPGTGKTRVAALLIAATLKIPRPNEEPTRVLAVTHSNGAADVLLEALLQMSVPAVRLGRPASISPHMQHRTVVALAEKMPNVIELRRKLGDATLDSQSRSGAAFELRASTFEVQNMITQTAPVVVTSCIGAHQLMDDCDGDIPFSMVVLDEAAQTTEPALLCALAAAKTEQMVLIGDTKQLPPTVTANGLRETLGVSPMARLEKAGVGLFTLQTQYRMSPALLEHPSKYFYSGLVGCAEQVKNVEPPAGFPWPFQTKPLAFVQVGSGDAEVQHNFGGRSNPTEAELAASIVSKVLASGELDASKIAVISPYAKQVQLIRAELSGQRDKAHMVRVGTVDSFQGQETDMVVFSAVRSNPLKELGFLRDSRRLCVAITRARRGLVILGDRSTLQTCRHWAALLESCDSRECSMDARELEVATIPSFPGTMSKRFDAGELFDEEDDFYGLFPVTPSSETTSTGNFPEEEV